VPTGNDIERLRGDLATAPQRVMRAAAGAARSALARGIDQGFARRVDIHGKPYPEAKDRPGAPMDRTGTLREAIRVDVQPGLDAFKVRAHEETSYGVHLRDGTPSMQARQFIPRPEEPLPAAWDARVRGAIQGAIRGEEGRS
jgi:hypothetical protein